MKTERLIITPELAEVVWGTVAPYTSVPDDNVERAIFFTAAAAGLGAHGIIVVDDGEWHRASLVATDGKVRLESDAAPASLITEINGRLAALFPVAVPGARSRRSGLAL